MSILSSGTTIEASRYMGATGVMMRTSRLSCRMGPPSEKEWPVEPLGVDTMTPSIFCVTVSFWNFIVMLVVRVRLDRVMYTSLRAGGNSSPAYEAATRMRFSSIMSPDSIWAMALSSWSSVISESMPRFPPTFMVSTGVSSARWRRVRRVVPSPPKVTARSSRLPLSSSMVSACSAPSTDTGETTHTLHPLSKNRAAALRAAASASAEPNFAPMTIRFSRIIIWCPCTSL